MEQRNKQAERDREAVRIVETYSDMLMRIALNRVNSVAEAEDVVQGTYERLMRRQPRFESREHEKAWLIRTAIRICIDESRRASRRTSVPLNEEIASAYSQESFELLETIRTLPEKDRDAVYLFYYEEYSTKDVARILGEREGTTRSRLSRARKKLRTMMEGEADGQIL
ncbi:MAG: RNA polymerase sigma factor [Clostridia bacterium]|nr:RNA polymerase sigma factor [Clostridia bacterium]MBR3037148.1 RNA polymerase sigma factor [Clostridia bacterium]MBR3129354.1 RNA polymerase sigma factor [Clostridia bacterium]